MGRTAKYSEDLLLSAVVKYSEVVKTKIKATELAEWARKNIKGLEDVHDYHFTRPTKNPKTGKIEKRLCTERLEELNVARDTRQKENKNVLLSSVNIDAFFELDERSQRKAIQEARDIVNEYKRTNAYLRRHNDYLREIDNLTKDKISTLESSLKDFKKKQKSLERLLRYLKNQSKEEQIRKHLEQMGISDGDFDLQKYNDAMKGDLNQIFNIDAEIRKYQIKMNQEDDEKEEESKLLQDVDISKELTDF